MEILKRLIAIRAELCEVGLAKNQENSAQRFMFRGIDDIYNIVSPIMTRHGVTVVPVCHARTESEYTTFKGALMSRAVVDVEFAFYADDGSSIIARVFGEGSDAGDKATSKALAMAAKYAILLTLMPPLEPQSLEDADMQSPPPPSQSTTESPPENDAEKWRGIAADYLITFEDAKSLDDLQEIFQSAYDWVRSLPKDPTSMMIRAEIVQGKDKCKALLQKGVTTL